MNTTTDLRNDLGNDLIKNDQSLVVLCTCPPGSVAESLAKQLVEKRFAACVNIINAVTSVYVWDNDTQLETEAQLIIKTRQSRFDDLKTWLSDAHPYDVPEIIALPIVVGNENYLQWVLKQTQD